MFKLSKNLYSTILILFTAAALFAYDPPVGGDNADIFLSPALLGGGTSVTGGAFGATSSTALPAGLSANPALGAGEQRIVLDASWIGLLGTGDEEGLGHSVNLGFLIPTRAAVVAANLNFLTSPFEALPLGTSGTINASISKDLTDNFYLGAGLTASAGDNWGVAGDLGALYLAGDKAFFKNIRFGAALTGLGRPFTPATTGINGGAATGFTSLATPRLGIAATLLSESKVKIGASLDLSAPTFQNMIVDAGLEAVIMDIITLKSGWNFNLLESVNDRASLIPSVGLGVNLKLKSGNSESFLARNGWSQSEITPHAAFKPMYNGITGIGAGLNIRLGVSDTRAPQIEVDYPSPVYISPNNDGTQDELLFPVKISDQRYVLGWSFMIEDATGAVVRTIANKEVRPEMQNLKSFWSLLTRVKQGIALPETLRWDGILDSGETAADGSYFFYITAVDDNDNNAITEKFQVFVDNTAPTVTATAPSGANAMIFSPDGDGNKDSFPIAQDGSKEDLWTGTFLNSAETIVRTVETRDSAPALYAWDGKDNNNAIVSDGVYTYRIFGRDRAGNTAEATINNIIVDTDKPSINISIDINAFSPNGDGTRDFVRLSPSVPVITGLIGWEVQIQNRAGIALRAISGTGTPTEIVYDGRDNGGKVLAEGEYQAVITAKYTNGHSPLARSPYFTVDVTAPDAQVRSSGAIFSPVGDGKLDTVTFSQQMSTEIDWTGAIYAVDAAGKPADQAVRTFRFGGNPPATVVWDGRDDAGRLATDGRYAYLVSSTDRAGNTGKANLSIVELNTEKADLILQANTVAFSPNGDNVKDSIVFTPILKAATAVERYTLTITNAEKQTVKVITGTGRVPATLTWNGIADPAGGAATGTRAPDGSYGAVLDVTLVNQQTSRSACPDFEIDTKFPTIEISAPYLALSPNADGKNDSLPITQKSSIEDRWTGTFVNARNAVVRTRTWNGAVADFTWNAEDDSGNRVSDGTYSYIIMSEDRAGNRTTQQLTGVTVDARVPKAFITVELPAFSPNGDGIKDTQRISVTTSIPEGLESWSILIKPEGSGTGPETAVKTWTSADRASLPAAINWDGKNNAGTVVQGNFYAELNLKYIKGDLISVSTAPFQVNSVAPTVSVRLAPRYFSPDNDGIEDELYISLLAQSVSSFTEWSFEIREPQGSAGNVFWKTGGTGTITERIVWDGRSQRGELVQAATDYPFTFTVKDAVGMTTVVRGYIPVDVLIIRDGDKLKIAVPSIIFRENAADFNGLATDVVDKNVQVLRRIAEILNKFKDYKVQVEGHANNVTGTQREEDTELIPLSRSRADAVRNFLIDNGVDSVRLSVIGMGGTRPVVTRTDRENWWKNRRVEFILIK